MPAAYNYVVIASESENIQEARDQGKIIIALNG